MIHKHFNFKEHGFVGHLAEPDGGSDRAVIIIMGGEQSLLPGIKFAESYKQFLKVFGGGYYALLNKAEYEYIYSFHGVGFI